MARRRERTPRVTVSVMLTVPEYDRLRHESGSTGASISDVIRSALRAWHDRTDADRATAEREGS